MNLDMRTVVVMLLVSCVLMAITLAVGIRAGRGAGFAKWNLGLGLYALGWLLSASRGVLPAIAGVALADSLMMGGLCFQIAAIAEFGGRAVPRSALMAPPPLMFGLLIPVLDNYPALNLVVSLSYAAAFGIIAAMATRLGPTAGPARWMLAAVYFAGAIMLPIRAADIWLHPGTLPSLFSASDLHIATFIVMFATTIVGSVSFLLMHRERAEAALYKLATFDALTGVFNRRAFMDLAEREIARARRAQSPYAVLMMDLDHFKRVNDDYGHQAGDRVLAGFAAVAKRSVRTEDLVGRYGGEEFCALLPGANMRTAIAIAERVRESVRRDPLGALPRAITVSIGVTLNEAGSEATLAAAIALADAALYRAKDEGRDRVVALDGDSRPVPGNAPVVAEAH